MMRLKKVFWLTAIFLFFSNLYPTYLLIYEADDGVLGTFENKVPLEELEKAYHQVLMVYDFPMCLYLSQGEDKKILLGNNPNQVEKLINAKLETINPHIRVFWIPTTLYELFVTQYFFKNENFNKYVIQLGYSYDVYDKESAVQEALSQEFLSKYSLIHSDERFIPDVDSDILALLKNPQIHVNDVYQAYLSRNHNSDLCAFFLQINEAFLQFVLNEHFAIQSTYEVSSLLSNSYKYKNLISDIPLNEEGWRLSHHPFAFLTNSDPLLKEELIQHRAALIEMYQEEANKISRDERGFIQTIIEEEIHIHQHNKCLIYRGAPLEEVFCIDGHQKAQLLFLPFAITRDKKDDLLQTGDKWKSYSLSYGNSFLGGQFFSVYACAARYSQRLYEPYVFHVLELDKAMLNDMQHFPFTIPPLNALANLLADGELFHVHSKIGLSMPFSKESDTTCVISELPIKDYPGYILLSKMTALDLGIQIFELSASCMRVLKKDHLILSPEINNFENQIKQSHLSMADYLRQFKQ